MKSVELRHAEHIFNNYGSYKRDYRASKRLPKILLDVADGNEELIMQITQCEPYQDALKRSQESRQRISHFCKALRKIKPKERRVLRMIYLGRMTQREVGQIVGYEQPHIHRIKKQALRNFTKNIFSFLLVNV